MVLRTNYFAQVAFTKLLAKINVIAKSTRVAVTEALQVGIQVPDSTPEGEYNNQDPRAASTAGTDQHTHSQHGTKCGSPTLLIAGAYFRNTNLSRLQIGLNLLHFAF